MKKFQFRVEVLELQRYSNKKGEVIYSYVPFLADIPPQKNLTVMKEAFVRIV